MRTIKPTYDPYRVLGLTRGAEMEQVKAAHRRLAKLFHPDGSTGDEKRFLAVQEAYQLLSDPERRREWDRRHAPGPVRADTRRPRSSTSATSSSGGRQDRPPGPGPSRSNGRAPRDSGPRRYTWSAAGVPWWEEFRKRDATGPGPASGDTGPTAADGNGATARADGGPTTAPDGGPTPATDASRQMDFDVFDRSSGAAWSMAARRHFRRGDADLPSRGAFRYRGTQVVTGAEARKVAAEEAAADAAAQVAEDQRRANDAAQARRDRTAPDERQRGG